VYGADARALPLGHARPVFVFTDPPYSTHLKYSGDPRCIGELSADAPAYYEAMGQVIAEINRVLRPGRHMALYVSDSQRKGKPFLPIGFELFAIMRKYFEPVDIVSVVRHNRTMLRRHWHTAAVEGNYYLRGFNYLFIMRKAGDEGDRRKPEQVREQLESMGVVTEKPSGAEAVEKRGPRFAKYKKGPKKQG
ncbi:MAG: hypothetical protein EG825_16690, partial [Rhodocyclaceae bacterium]|nr:hypothetical protein [Rhodocyclaceae bacterium]